MGHYTCYNTVNPKDTPQHHTGGFLMSRKCDHDWFDHYMMYSMMNNTGNTGGGGNDWGCLLIILACILFLPAFYLFMLLMNAIGDGIVGLFSYLVNLIGG